MTDPTPPPAFVEVMAQVLEQCGPIREAVMGYRTQLVSDGFSPAAAEDMASDLHRHLIAAMFGPAGARR